MLAENSSAEWFCRQPGSRGLAGAAVVLFLLGIASRASAAAGIEPSPFARITTNYYVFGGTNETQMRAAIVEARPWKESMIFDAQTKWDIQSIYRCSRTNGQFRLSAADVKAKIAITLPLWIPGKPVSPQLVAKWQKCFAGLSAHEQGHLQLALAAGAEVRRRLNELPAFAFPRELAAAADHVVQDTIEEFRQRERKYDEVTGHGRTQGAVFPIRVNEEGKPIVSSVATNSYSRKPRW